MFAHRSLSLVDQVLGDFDRVAQRLAQGGAQRAEKSRARHQHQAIESILLLGLLEFLRDATRESLRLLHPRTTLSAGAVM
jgi:hypothetical protein